MKAKALIFALALSAAALAGQGTFRLTRSFKVGDTDIYKLHSTATMSVGDADISMKIDQTVKKVYDNGEADIENGMSDFQVIFNGSEIPTSIPNRVEGDVTNMNIQPDENAPPITAMKFVMERVK